MASLPQSYASSTTATSSNKSRRQNDDYLPKAYARHRSRSRSRENDRYHQSSNGGVQSTTNRFSSNSQQKQPQSSSFDRRSFSGNNDQQQRFDRRDDYHNNNNRDPRLAASRRDGPPPQAGRGGYDNYNNRRFGDDRGQDQRRSGPYSGPSYTNDSKDFNRFNDRNNHYGSGGGNRDFNDNNGGKMPSIDQLPGFVPGLFACFDMNAFKRPKTEKKKVKKEERTKTDNEKNEKMTKKSIFVVEDKRKSPPPKSIFDPKKADNKKGAKFLRDSDNEDDDKKKKKHDDDQLQFDNLLKDLKTTAKKIDPPTLAPSTSIKKYKIPKKKNVVNNANDENQNDQSVGIPAHTFLPRDHENAAPAAEIYNSAQLPPSDNQIWIENLSTIEKFADVVRKMITDLDEIDLILQGSLIDQTGIISCGISQNYRLNNERSFDRRHNWRGGDWRRTAPFRQSGGGGGRFDDVNFQNRRRQTNRRPDDEPEKPILNLFDPTDVPKGRGYFEHEDRGNYPDFKKRRGSFMNRREDQQYNFRGQQRNGTTDDVDSGFMWSHDKYEEVQQELQRAKSGDKK
uniref:Uncharacterized protein n=1 Tax=Romanomermis culicivorax TaxID=13658 RepID=A0A915IIC8_ROMCU